MEILKEKKISIHKPRKDQCDTCTGHTFKSVDELTYEEHILKKEEARLAKNDAKSECSDTCVVVTMDAQSVLLSPKLHASAAYYKRKLQVHNFTFYKLNDGHVTLYVWHEGDGGVTCNEFTSCVTDYIKKLPRSVNRCILISDGCAYQNRNKVLSSSLRDLSFDREIEIEQLYLERGHTMMECDSVHSTLEQIFKSTSIYAPADYIFLMKNVRPKQPYDVVQVDYKFFYKYDNLSTNMTSIKPSKKV
jgi:hypothetical protein